MKNAAKPRDIHGELAAVPRKKLPSSLELGRLPLLASKDARVLTLEEQEGLDARGSRLWSYGPRTFTLHIDDHFGLRVREPEGGLLKELPPARAGDDPALVAQSPDDKVLS